MYVHVCHKVTTDRGSNGGKEERVMVGDQSIIPVAFMMTSPNGITSSKNHTKAQPPCSLVHKAFELSQRHDTVMDFKKKSKS